MDRGVRMKLRNCSSLRRVARWSLRDGKQRFRRRTRYESASKTMFWSKPTLSTQNPRLLFRTHALWPFKGVCRLRSFSLDAPYPFLEVRDITTEKDAKKGFKTIALYLKSGVEGGIRAGIPVEDKRTPLDSSPMVRY